MCLQSMYVVRRTTEISENSTEHRTSVIAKKAHSLRFDVYLATHIAVVLTALRGARCCAHLPWLFGSQA